MGTVSNSSKRMTLRLNFVLFNFQQYDGDNVTKGYADEEDSENFGRVFGPGRPASSARRSADQAERRSAGSPERQHLLRPFDISLSSSSRLGSAVQKRRERLKVSAGLAGKMGFKFLNCCFCCFLFEFCN